MYVKNQPAFKGYILSGKNIQLVNQVRARITRLGKEGIPVGNCVYRFPEGETPRLETKDKRFSVCFTEWEHNLKIAERTPESEKEILITQDNNVKYSKDDSDFIDVKPLNILADNLNRYLSDVLKKFL